MVLTEAQARQAIQDRIDADSYFFQLQQAKTVAKKSDSVIVELRTQVRNLKGVVATDSVTIHDQVKKIKRQSNELWLLRSSVASGWIFSIFKK